MNTLIDTLKIVNAELDKLQETLKQIKYEYEQQEELRQILFDRLRREWLTNNGLGLYKRYTSVEGKQLVIIDVKFNADFSDCQIAYYQDDSNDSAYRLLTTVPMFKHMVGLDT